MSEKYSWHVGMRVVCVDDRFHPGVEEWGDQLPKEGEIYTIRQLVCCPCGVTGKVGVALRLAGLVNPGDRLAFSPWHFKPLAAVLREDLERWATEPVKAEA